MFTVYIYIFIGKDAGGFGVGFRCACPIGQKLVDGKRCIPAVDYLLFRFNLKIL